MNEREKLLESKKKKLKCQKLIEHFQLAQNVNKGSVTLDLLSFFQYFQYVL